MCKLGAVRIKARTVKLKMPAPTANLQPRITVVGSAQGIRVTYPDPKKGGIITQAFLSQYKSSSVRPNEAAEAVAAGDGFWYTIVKGDWLSKIAPRFNVSNWKRIYYHEKNKKFRRLRTDPNLIHPGDQVWIPGKGHEYGSLKLPRFEEPSYTDFGEHVGSNAGSALVIGNNNYDPSKKMGSSAIPNRKLNTCCSDADKIEAALEGKGYTVEKLYDQNGASIKKAVNAISTTFVSGGSFMFYFCGHGTFDGLIGTDGVAVPHADLTALISAALSAKSDLLILIDACHQGEMVDQSRLILFDPAKKHNASRPKLRSFIDEAENLAAEKGNFVRDSRKVLEEQWKIENPTPTGTQMDMKKWEETYAKRIDVWNEFVKKAQPKVNAAIEARNKAYPGLEKLNLVPYARARSAFSQDDEVKMWAQLDSIDFILNQALASIW